MSDAEINDSYSKDLIHQINRIFINNLALEYNHLLLSQVSNIYKLYIYNLLNFNILRIALQ